MQQSLNSYLYIFVALCFLTLSCKVNADGDTKQQFILSGKFATELSKNGDFVIASNQEYCSSNKRPLCVSQEMAEMLSLSLQYANHIKIKSECKKVVSEKEYQFCRFYFFSPNKNEQWTMGFTFLGNPNDGKIKVDSIQCFSTP